MSDVFQVMPPLTADEYAALRADIAARGIVVPVLVDQHGRTLDGHHRRAIAAELGIECPVEVRQVADDEDARTTALALNLSRRHLTREQKRELIAAEVERCPDASDREIARRLGCSHRTVAAVRRPAEVDNLSTRGPRREPCPGTGCEVCGTDSSIVRHWEMTPWMPGEPGWVRMVQVDGHGVAWDHYVPAAHLVAELEHDAGWQGESWDDGSRWQARRLSDGEVVHVRHRSCRSCGTTGQLVEYIGEAAAEHVTGPRVRAIEAVTG